jgi:hypothetical protein
MSPSATNRITVVAGIGNYDFGSSSFDMDTQHIDLVSLDGNRSIVFNSSNSGAGIFVSANDVFIKGIDTQSKPFRIGDNLNLLKIENCKGGNASFGGNNNVPPPNNFSAVNVSGTFTNCEGGSISFGGGGGTASGTFIDCIGGSSSFGSSDSGNSLASGIFENCKADASSFGGGLNGNEASGTFTNCKAGSTSFGGSFAGIASGTFIRCEGGGSDFGGDSGTLTGTLTDCVSEGFFAFSRGGTLSGKLYRCRNRTSTFPNVSGGGVTVLCIDGNNQINSQN